MLDVTPQLAEVLRLQEKRTAAELKVQALDDQMKRHMAELQDRIRAGATTGDHIRDFVLVKFGLNTESEERYRSIDAALKGRCNEMVLVTYQEQVCIFHGGCFGAGENQYRWEGRFACTVLTGEELVMTYKPRMVCALPSAKVLMGKGLQIHEESLEEEYPYGYFSLSAYDKRAPEGAKCCLIIGDSAVKKWLELNRTPTNFAACAVKLDKLVLIPPDENAPYIPHR